MTPQQRALFLNEACGKDAGLRADIEELLEAHDVSNGPLDRPVFEAKQHAPALANDQLIGQRFRIRRFVGRGGMGEVYEAEDLELRLTVALKTLRPEHVSNPSLQALFRREIGLARRVSHRNVCKVFDFGKHVSDGSETAFLTMEFLQGQTLAEHLEGHGRLAPQEALALIRQMAEGLAALAEAGVVHRDFKPGNIMLTPAPEGPPTVVITDFGLARPLSTEKRNTLLSSAGLLIGTPAYMAPEQLLGEEVGPFSDVYALAVVAYEMVTGGAPFKGKTAIQLMLRKLTEAPPAPTAVVPDLDPGWNEFILRCMERDVERRVHSPQEVLRLLDDLEQGRLTVRERPSGTEAGSRKALVEPIPVSPVTGPIRKTVDAIRKRKIGWRWPRAAAAAATVAATGALLVVPGSVREPVALQLCNWFPGSSMFCALPEDKDLAVLPFVVEADSQKSEAIGRGLATLVTRAFYRLYPDKSEMCVHLRGDHRSDGVKLKVVPSVVVAGGSAHFRAEIREATLQPSRTTGRMLRRVDRRVSLEDLQGLHEGLLLALADALELEYPENEWKNWVQSRPANSSSLVDSLEGFGRLQSPASQPSERRADYENAAGLFTGVISPLRDFVYAPAHVGLAEAYRLLWAETGDESYEDRAENAYRRAVRLDAEHGFAEAERHFAKLDMDAGRVEARIDRLERAHATALHDHYLQKELAEAYESQGQDAKVEQVKRFGIEQRPECWLARNTAGAFYSRHAMLREAENHLLEVTKLTPKNTSAYHNLAMDYIKSGRYAEAIDFAAQSIQMGGAPRVYTTLGLAYFYSGCRDDAFANLQEATDQSPEDYRGWYSLAEVLWSTPGRQAMAADASLKADALAQAVVKRESEKSARDQRPEAPALAHAARAVSLAFLDFPKQAREEAGRAFQLAPKNHEVLFELAKAYELIGDRDEAIDRLRRSMMGDLVPQEQDGYSPTFDWVRQDERFTALLRESGAPLGHREKRLTCPGWDVPGLGLRNTPMSQKRFSGQQK